MIACFILPYFATDAMRQSLTLPLNTTLNLHDGKKIIAHDATGQILGVQTGMMLRQAQALAPDAQFMRAEQSVIDAHIASLLTRLSEFTSQIEVAFGEPIREKRKRYTRPYPYLAVAFYLDFEGLNLNETLQLVAFARRAIAPVLTTPPSVGIAAHRFTSLVAAYAANHELDNLMLVTGKESEFLAAQPIILLPIADWILDKLHILGLNTLGKLTVLSNAALYAQFGGQGLLAYQFAHGFDSRRIIPFRPQIVEQVEQSFDRVVTQSVALDHAVQRLSEQLSKRLQKRGCMGRTLSLRLDVENGSPLERKISLRQPISGTVSIMRAASRMLTRQLTTLAPLNVTGITLTLTDIIPFAGQQLDLFTNVGDQQARLQESLETLILRYGEDCFKWVIPNNPNARLLEQRYQFQPVSLGDVHGAS